jgi:RNA polymerase sigma factor (sigma-70 family)
MNQHINDAYMERAKQFPLLTKADQKRLGLLIRAGQEAAKKLPADPKEQAQLRRLIKKGDQAKNQFLESNLRLVTYIITRDFSWSPLPIDDMVQEGNLGLLRAVEKFDWEKGFTFATYAKNWIRNFITRAIDEQGRSVHLSARMGPNQRIIRNSINLLTQELRREPTIEEISKDVNLDAEVIIRLLLWEETLSADVPLHLSKRSDVLTAVSRDHSDNRPTPEEVILERSLEQDVEKLLSVLDEKERRVIELRYGLSHTNDGQNRTRSDQLSQRTVGQIMEMEHQQVWAQERNAKVKMFEAMDFNPLTLGPKPDLVCAANGTLRPRQINGLAPLTGAPGGRPLS